jgi:lysophospholipase L1-like esterase
MKKKDILIIALITMALLIVMEIACRLLGGNRFADSDFRFYVRNVDNDLLLDYVVEDPLLMWSLKPGYNEDYINRIRDLKYSININSRGFRDLEYRVNKDDRVFRILCLGDSSTFGIELPVELTYHSLLEDRLNREYDGRRRFEVINAGVVGYTSIQGLYMYLSRGARFKPDLVTFYFGVNEPIRNFYLSDAEIMKIGRPQWLNVLINGWLLKSELVRVTQKAAMNVINKNNRNSRLPVPRVSPADYRNAILHLKDACDRNGSKLLLISPALYMNRCTNKYERAMEIVQYRKILEKTAAQNGIPLLTIPEMTEYASKDPNYLFLKSDWLHPGQAGHRLITQRLHDFMINNRMLP